MRVTATLAHRFLLIMSTVFANALRHPWSRPLALVADAALLLLVVFLLTRFVWLALDWNAPLPRAEFATLPLAEVTPPSASLSTWHLFGQSSLPVDQRALANAPETQLPIDLRGVLAGPDPKHGRAFIADSNGERGYNVGQEVASGVMLDAVYSDRIALSRGGAIEVLKLRSPAAANGTTAPAPAPTRAGVAGNAASPSVPVGASSTVIPPDRAVFGRIDASNLPMQGVDMERVKQTLGVDPAVLANQITPLPVMENGKFVGVRLNAGPHAAALGKLGLQPEDVVTAINGVAVTDPTRIGAAVAGLSQASRIEVQVRRNGRAETLTVDIPR